MLKGSCTVSYRRMRPPRARHCLPSPRQSVIDHVIAAGLPAFTPHTITSPDVLRRKLSVIRLTQIATSRNEFECGKAAIAMPIFYGGGRVAAAIELAVRDLGSELKPAASALSVACRSPRANSPPSFALGKPKRLHHPQSGARAGRAPPIPLTVAATRAAFPCTRGNSHSGERIPNGVPVHSI